MRALRALIRKDLARKLRAPAGVLLTLAFPLVLVAVIGSTFSPDDDILPQVDLLVENRDGAFLSEMLSTGLRNEQAAEYFNVTLVDSGAGEALVGKGDASALVVIPAGFSDRFFAREPVTLDLVRNPGESILPEIAESYVEFLALVLTAASRVFAEPLDEIRALIDDDAGPSEATVSSIAVDVRSAIVEGERLLLPPAIDVQIEERFDEEAEDDTSRSINLFAYLFPGVIALGLLFVAQQSLRDLLWEREHGHLARLLATPVPIRTVVLSKLLSTVALLVLCHLLLAVVGALVFGIRWSDGFAALLLVLAQGVAVTGILAFVFAVTKSERQADVLSTIVIFGMSILGGSMIPSEVFPGSVQAFSKWTINYWTIEGFRKVSVFGGGLGDIGLHLLILTAVGTTLFFASAALFERNLRR